jgi:phosphotransferase system enzyme I (PtsI)
MRDPPRALASGTSAHSSEALVLSGVPASPGVAIGRVLVYAPGEWRVPDQRVAAEEAPREHQRFEEAVERTRHALAELRDRLHLRGGEAPPAFVFQSHAALLDDPLFRDRVREDVLVHRRTAESAVSRFAEYITQAFREVDDGYFRDKAGDISDVLRHVMSNLSGAHASASRFPGDTATDACVVLAAGLLPSDTLLLPRDKVIGFATETGSRLSHVAILANALQIPAVVGLGVFLGYAQDGDMVILDGTHGTVVLRPSPEQVRAYRHQRDALLAFERRLTAVVRQPAETVDGERVQLLANIELPDEVEACARFGADGVGLYRTEYGYLNRPALPSEDELFEDYRAVLTRAAPMEVTLRTIDVGGDKVAPLLSHGERADGMEHLRALRLCLRFPEIWMPQLRAIWRAAVHGNARLMFPLVPGVAEFRAARALALQAREELRRERIRCADVLPIGVMVELPSAVTVCDLLAREADFFSIGTNDLIPYSLGIDRTHMDLTMSSEPYHPGILRAIQRVVEEGRRAGIPVVVCGEMAGDPFLVLPFLGMGLRCLSMHPAAIPEVKQLIRHVTVAEAEALLRDVLLLATAQSVDHAVHAHMHGRYAGLLAASVGEGDSGAEGDWASANER